MWVSRSQTIRDALEELVEVDGFGFVDHEFNWPFPPHRVKSFLASYIHMPHKKGRVACWLHDPEVWLLRKCIFRNFGRKKCTYV